jgi:hypothetical protein
LLPQKTEIFYFLYDFRMTKYYKILRGDLTHYGFTYQLGLNVDPVSFNPKGLHAPCGLSYADINNIFTYTNFGSLIAEVEPVGQIHQDYKAWKTDKLVVHNITPLTEWFDKQTYEMKLFAVKQCGTAIRHINNPTEELKLEAVLCHPLSIEYIDDPSEEVQLVAVEKNAQALQYIKYPTYPVQLAAVRGQGVVISYIKNPSLEIQMEAVRQTGYAILRVYRALS